MTTPTPERSIEEIKEELRNKILDIETAVRLTYNEKDSDQMIDKLLNHYTQTLQAERQASERAVMEERERIIKKLEDNNYFNVRETLNPPFHSELDQDKV